MIIVIMNLLITRFNQNSPDNALDTVQRWLRWEQFARGTSQLTEIPLWGRKVRFLPHSSQLVGVSQLFQTLFSKIICLKRNLLWEGVFLPYFIRRPCAENLSTAVLSTRLGESATWSTMLLSSEMELFSLSRRFFSARFLASLPLLQ